MLRIIHLGASLLRDPQLLGEVAAMSTVDHVCGQLSNEYCPLCISMLSLHDIFGPSHVDGQNFASGKQLLDGLCLLVQFGVVPRNDRLQALWDASDMDDAPKIRLEEFQF